MSRLFVLPDPEERLNWASLAAWRPGGPNRGGVGPTRQARRHRVPRGASPAVRPWRPRGAAGAARIQPGGPAQPTPRTRRWVRSASRFGKRRRADLMRSRRCRTSRRPAAARVGRQRPRHRRRRTRHGPPPRLVPRRTGRPGGRPRSGARDPRTPDGRGAGPRCTPSRPRPGFWARCSSRPGLGCATATDLASGRDAGPAAFECRRHRGASATFDLGPGAHDRRGRSLVVSGR